MALIHELSVPNSSGQSVSYTFDASTLNSKAASYYENLPLGTCVTAAATAAKTVTITGFELVTGARAVVKFNNSNTASTPTLNINSLGAKSIYYKGATTKSLVANHLYEFIYDGTAFNLIGQIDTDTDLKAASGNTSSKIYLIGATSQSTSGQTTQSHDTAFVDTDGQLNSYDTTAATTSTVITSAQKGIAGGVATLGDDGKVPSGQLPSYVDDVLEYSAQANFPTKGETDKIYVDTTTNKTYRWSGSAYVEISPGTYSVTIVGGSSTATANAAVTTNDVYLNEVFNSAVVSTHKITGSGDTTVTSDSSGNITITTPTKDLEDFGGVGIITTSGSSPLNLNASKSDTTVTISGSVSTAGANSLGVVKGFHRTSGTATGTQTTNATNAPAVNARTTTSSRYYGIETDAVGKMYVNVPWTDTNTKVTSVGNHYTPAEDSNSVLDVDASSTEAATWGSTDLVTGVTLKRDAKGHVVGLEVDSIQMPANPDTNTTYSAGTGISLSGTTFSNSGVRSITQDSTNGHKLTINTGGKETTITIPDKHTEYGIATSSTLGLVKSGGDITINSSTGIMSVVDDSHNHIISNVDGLQDALNGKADVHDHPYLPDSTKYAASATPGGSASSAVKLDTATAGDANTPVYFTDGKPTACTSLGLSTTGTAAAWTNARTLTVKGDASGSVSVKGNANMTLTLTVADDSHNHIISNVDGLEDRLAAIEDCLTWHNWEQES